MVVINSVAASPVSDPPTGPELDAVALLGALDEHGDILWSGSPKAMFKHASNRDTAANTRPCGRGERGDQGGGGGHG